MLKLHPGKGRWEGWGGARTPRHCERPHLEPGMVNSSHPQKTELIWALATVTSSTWRWPITVLRRKMLAIKAGWGWGWRCMYISGQANCKDQGQWIWDSAFSSRLLGWVSPVCSFRSLWTLVSAVSQEPALRGPHRLAALSIGSQLGWRKEALAGEQSVGSGFRVFIPLPSLLPSPWSHGGLTVGVLIPGNLLMEPHLLSGSGNPTLLLTSEAQVSTGGPSATSSKVLYYSVCVSLNHSRTALFSDSCWGCHCFPASTLTSTRIKNWHLPASTHICHALD